MFHNSKFYCGTPQPAFTLHYGFNVKNTTQFQLDIKEEIEAKLKEHEGYALDHVLEYIIDLVANNTTKEQMEDSLDLFLLNKNTSAFINWLHTVGENLKKVTL